jgi:hypothetical protein
MRSSPTHIAALVLAMLASAALCGASLAQDTDPVEQAAHDKVAFERYSPTVKTLVDNGNLPPRFDRVIVLRSDKSGHGTAGYLALAKTDAKYAFLRTQWYNEAANGLAAYGFYFDGFADFFATGGVGWKRSETFPRERRSWVTLSENWSPSASPRTLYVSEISETYPGFEWLVGPFSIIRQQGDDKVYAVWSARLNWPVKTSSWEVKGAVVDGKAIGQTDVATLAAAAAGKAFPYKQAQLAERQASFEKALHAKPAALSGPVDLLAEYKGQAIRDPEAAIASTYIPAPVAGATAVSAVDVRVTSPALWTVSRGARKVYILGAPWLFREDVDWNKVRLTNRLRDAQRGRLILPPALDEYEDREFDPALDTNPMPEAYKDRVRRAAAVIGQPAERYLNLSPLMAGYQLTTDFRAGAGLKHELVALQVAKLGQTLSLSMNVAGAVGGPNGNVNGPPPAAGLYCLDAALDEVEAGKPAFDRAMEAWAKGDVRVALTAPRGLERCSFAFPGEAQIREDGITEQVEAIEASLSPGVSSNPLRGNAPSVAVVHLRALLSVDGVLARLQAQGYKIDAPRS